MRQKLIQDHILPNWFENIRPHKILHINVSSSFIQNHQKLEATKWPSNKWMDKQTVDEQPERISDTIHLSEPVEL